MILYAFLAFIGLIIVVPALVVWFGLAVLNAIVEFAMFVIISFIAIVGVLVNTARGDYS